MLDRATAALDALTRPEQRVLRALLIEATAGAARHGVANDLGRLVAAAHIDALPAAAALHRVSGSVGRGLDGVDGVPDGVRRELAGQRNRASMHHLLVVGALSQIGRSLDEAGLAWVVMKGPVVAGLFYPDVGDRTYADLDLLVARRDFPQAMRVLEDLGYRHDIHNWALAEQTLAGEVGMKSATVQIDLHWHLQFSTEDRRQFEFSLDAMVDRARRVVVSGVNVSTLDPVDTLLTLAFHAARSDGHRLVWFKDVERAVAVDHPDLDELVRRCAAYRCGPPVGLILGRARALLGADIPPEIIRATTPATVRSIDRLVTKVVHPVQLHERGTASRLLTRSVKSSTVGSLLAVPERSVRSLRRSLFPPRDNESDDANEKASYLEAVSASVRK